MYFGLFVYNMETENTSRNNSVSHEVDLGVIRLVKWSVSLYMWCLELLSRLKY